MSLPLLFLRIGALKELQYRVNFFLQLLQSLIALGVGLVGLALVFEHTGNLGGWSRPELLAVMGVHILMGGILQATIQPNMIRLMQDVQEGMLDFALTKPADSQLMVSMREFRIWQLVNLVMGGIVLNYAINQLQIHVGLAQALGFAAAILLGGLIFYSFWLILTTGVFWLTRMDNIFELFNGLYQAGRWPVSVYPDWLRNGLTFIVPVAFAVTVPAEALTNRLNAQTLLLALIVAVSTMSLARWFWFFGLRHYSGASS
jgi:ABC-2 type transport system permease protein